MQLIREAQKICPDVIIVLGEDISRFRDASKDLYHFLRAFSWSQKVERLGFDEVWMDTTDMVEYNLELLNHSDLAHSFFCVSRDDPTVGFSFDATAFVGHTYPEESDAPTQWNMEDEPLRLRLLLASHLAQWLRHQLEAQKGYTSTVGVSTSKVLSKLVGNLHKPKSQTTLLPPYLGQPDVPSNVTAFIDGHEVGKIPGIGFKMATKIRSYVLKRNIEYDNGLVTGRTKDTATVGEVARFPGLSAESLERILAGPGSPHGIGVKIWQLINGVDDSEVGQAREVPRQISIEDSYIRLDTVEEVLKELGLLARSLIKRMHIDLLQAEDMETNAMSEDQDETGTTTPSPAPKRWLAHPRTIRLSTRPRPAPNPDGSRNRSFGRISRSGPLPGFIFSLLDNIDALADRLVHDVLVPMFKKLHPERSGWNLSLVNLAVTNMVDAATDKGTGGVGRDISKMFKNQDHVLKDWKIEDRDVPPDPPQEEASDIQDDQMADQSARHGSEDALFPTQDSQGQQEEEWDDAEGLLCHVCGSSMPLFAVAAHARFHSAGE